MKGYVKSICIGVLTMVLCFCSACAGYVVGKEDGLKESPSVVKSPLVIAPKEENNISLAVADIAMEDYEAYGVSATAESAKTITATVTPDYATNKEVDYSIAWVNASSEWASGKTVTDYVTVVQESDGALTATVSCLQAFGEQIEITCVARSNENAKATCTVDFERILDSVVFRYGNQHYEMTDIRGTAFDCFSLNFSYDEVASLGLDIVEHKFPFDMSNPTDTSNWLSFSFSFIVESSKPYTIDSVETLIIRTFSEWETAVNNIGYDIYNDGFLGTTCNHVMASYHMLAWNFTAPFFLPNDLMPLSFLNIPILDNSVLNRQSFIYSATELFTLYSDVYYLAKSYTKPQFAIVCSVGGEALFACYVRIDPDSIEIPVNAVAMSSASLSF